MNALTIAKPMTAEDVLAMPADGMDRWLIHGELREKPMTVRNRFHSKVEARVCYYLTAWQLQFAKSSGAVLVGEAGFRLPGDPETLVGIDVAYVSSETMAQQGKASTLIEGVPVLAVEILSPSDTQLEVHEKIGVYLATGVQLVWIIDPDYKTVTVFESAKSPVLYNQEQILAAEPHLSGFSVAVSELFA